MSERRCASKSRDNPPQTSALVDVKVGGIRVVELAAASSTTAEPPPEEHRAFLQRGETRLSTLHRVAGSFISGAGLLTLLPVLINNVFSGMLASLVFRQTSGIPEPASLQRWLVLVPVLASMGLPLAALYLLIRDLTQFYYTPRPFQNKTVGGVYPRFILSGLKVPSSGPPDPPVMHRARQEKYVTDLIVPSTSDLRRRLLKEAHTVGELESYHSNDDEKAFKKALREYLFSATGAEHKSLAEESAKMEASIVRHTRKLLTLVLRYAKAFLLTIVTTVVTIIAAGTLSLLSEADNQTAPISGVSHEHVWLVVLTLYAAWCIVAVVVVRRPIHWVFIEVDNTLAEQTPPSLKSFERSTVIISLIAVFAVDSSLLLYSRDVSPGLVWWPILAAVASFSLAIYIAGRVLWVERKEGRLAP